MKVSVFVCSNPHRDGVQKSNWSILHAITWCERAYDPYLFKSSRSGADHSVAIRLQTAEIGHHHWDRQFMDFFHGRQSPICPEPQTLWNSATKNCFESARTKALRG